jgi:hypothetical protein
MKSALPVAVLLVLNGLTSDPIGYFLGCACLILQLSFSSFICGNSLFISGTGIQFLQGFLSIQSFFSLVRVKGPYLDRPIGPSYIGPFRRHDGLGHMWLVDPSSHSCPPLVSSFLHSSSSASAPSVSQSSLRRLRISGAL